MNSTFDDQEFENIDFTTTPLETGEYNGCSFVNCNLEGLHLSNINFIECEFVDCNLSNARVKNTMLQEIEFHNCKLMGIQFSECNPFLFALYLNQCNLNFSSFYSFSVKSIRFNNCSLEEVDFTEADAEGVVFSECVFSRAVFENTNLKKSDFRTSSNFIINPQNNLVMGAHFKREQLGSLLTSYKLNIS